MIREFKVIPTGTGFSIYFELVNNMNKPYEQRIEVSEGEAVVWNCTCTFGSTFRFNKNFNGEDKRCRHIKECIELLVYLGYIKK